MKPFLYKFFHQKTNDRTEGGLVNIPKNREEWPEQWKRTSYKEYVRSENISLSDTFAQSPFFNLLKNRNSDVSKISGQDISIDDLSCMLKAGYGLISLLTSERRTVPSGGARFPLELYIVIWGDVLNLEKRNYHYDIKLHALNILHSQPIEKKDIATYTPYEWAGGVHGAILLSAVFDRTIDKYGSRGYRYLLLEAGHIGQNICLAATERGLQVRPMGGVNERCFEKLLSLDSDNEQLVYAIFF